MLHELVCKFPKSEKHSLGHQCQSYLLAAMEYVLAAGALPKTDAKLERLRQASAKLDILRLLIRLAKDTKCISNGAYLEISSKLIEAGKMLGGWIKSLG